MAQDPRSTVTLRPQVLAYVLHMLSALFVCVNFFMPTYIPSRYVDPSGNTMLTRAPFNLCSYILYPTLYMCHKFIRDVQDTSRFNEIHENLYLSYALKFGFVKTTQKQHLTAAMSV